ncbi:hypothetical protein GCM10009682_38090 [Luedemannella flava]|uniref:Ribulose-1,5-bisphosphate carboxylase/oxygenase large subunit n=1 Tax=Luedemannella flava TaxID=349316 RepID=A0ABP4YET3_9ACTN
MMTMPGDGMACPGARLPTKEPATAFSWPARWQAELDQAKIDFPGVTYTP